MKYYIDAIKNYAVFEGRTTRKEFWLFVLFNFIIAFSVGFILLVILVFAGCSDTEIDKAIDIGSNLYMLFMLLPTIAITVRRFHDIGWSGWWYFLTLIPILGWVFCFIMCAIDSEPFPNEYGESSKLGVVNLVYTGEEESEVIELDDIVK